MNRILIFQDYHKLETPSVYTDTQNLMSDIFGSGGQRKVGLRTSIRATHSGYLLNQRVYPGIRMKDSVGSWVKADRGGYASYNKPIILDHESYDSKLVIGRVRGAEFFQLKDGNEFLYDFKNPARGTDHGSGYIVLDGIVTDPEAIVRILDGRYDTVSTGQRPDAALCSICGFDWLNNSDSAEPCEHYPGRNYEIKDKTYICYLITGNLDYREVSYVTVPAQPNAGTLSANIEALDGLYSEEADGDAKVFCSIGDTANTLAFDLFDTDGNILDLIMKDDNDVMPDIATRFTKPTVSVPNTEDISMKKGQKMTTDEADSILDSWIQDHKDRTAEPSDENTEDDEVETQDDEEKETVSDVEKDEEKAVDDKSDEDSSDDESEAKDRISNKALAEAIDRVTEERDAMKVKNEELQTQIEERDELVSNLTEQLAKSGRDRSVDSARMLALIRVVTSHPSADGAWDSSDSFDKLVDTLSQRSIDSINDAITDSFPQLQDFLLSLKKQDAQSILDVADPTLTRTEDNKGKLGENDGETKPRMQSKEDFLED